MNERHIILVWIFALAAVASVAFLQLHNRPLGPPAQIPAEIPRGESSYPQARLDASRFAANETIRFLSSRTREDPDDMLAQNMLASQMLLRLRETGDAGDLDRALRAARASLASVPAVRNIGGISALARAEMAGHDFVSARSHALELTKWDPATAGSYAILADALLELGDYAGADAAIVRMRRLAPDNAETEIRQSRILFIQGDTGGAERHLTRALAFARNAVPQLYEPIAWCQWQLGEMRFSQGDYRAAGSWYAESLNTYPHYVQALAGRGRVLAAQGKLTEAAVLYEQAVARYPDPTFLAALGDIYRLSGRAHEAETQFALIDQIRKLNKLNGVRYNRQLALIDADHGQNSLDAYAAAVAEYRERRDIYGADAVAWTALKAGKSNEAQQAIRSALRLSTQDARLFYHAGMIANSTGERSSARSYLRRALALNPRFDPLQAPIALKTLDTLGPFYFDFLPWRR